MQFSLHTESFDTAFPLESEVKQMQHLIYFDIPIDKRDRYCELEKIWTTQREFIGDSEEESAAQIPRPPHLIPLSEEYATSAFKETFLPVGINSQLAVALSNMGEAKAHMISAEIEQYHLFWKAYLRRCRFKKQYTEKMNLLLKNSDQVLHRVAELILRDFDLIKFRDSLPEVLVDEGGLNTTDAEREDSAVISSSLLREDYQEEVDLPPTEVYGIYYQRYLGKKRDWKVSNHIFSSIAPPAASICEKYLLYAFYSSKSIITVRLCLFDQKKCVDEWKFSVKPIEPAESMKSTNSVDSNGDVEPAIHLPPLRCAINDRGWMAVSNGVSVHQKCMDRPIIYRHVIENQIISAIHLDMNGFLQIGTTNGQVYDVTPFKLRSYTKNRDCLAVLSISTSGGRKMSMQTVNGIFIPGPTKHFEDKHFDIVRPVTSIIHGPLILFLTKYGNFMIRSIIHNNVQINLPVLPNMTTSIHHITPWYDRGIYFDGETCAVLYPSGNVLVRKIKETMSP